jgi:hypothetical protein
MTIKSVEAILQDIVNLTEVNQANATDKEKWNSFAYFTGTLQGYKFALQLVKDAIEFDKL